MNAAERTILLASPPFPCGVSYLGDILLALNVKVEPPKAMQKDVYWNLQEDGAHEISGEPLRHYMTHFNTLQNKTKFIFDRDVRVVMEHNMGMACEPHESVIFFVRDPVDAAFSFYRRYFRDQLGFDEFMKRDIMAANHSSVLLSAKPLIVYAVFCIYWMCSCNRPVHIVRFEDIKHDPLKYVREVLSFIGVSRSDAEIVDAINGADTEKLINTNRNNGYNIAHKGRVGEWQERMSFDEWRDLIASEPMRSVSVMFGYIDGDQNGSIFDERCASFAEYQDGIIDLLDKRVGRHLDGRDSVAVSDINRLAKLEAASVLRDVRYRLPNSVLVRGSVSQDSRLFHGNMSAAVTLALLFNAVSYINYSGSYDSDGYSNSEFNKKFKVLSNAIFNSMSNVDVFSMVAWIASNSPSIGNGFGLSRLCEEVRANNGSDWSDPDEFNRIIGSIW